MPRPARCRSPGQRAQLRFQQPVRALRGITGDAALNCHFVLLVKGSPSSASSSMRRRAGSAERSEARCSRPSLLIRTSKIAASRRRRLFMCSRPAGVMATSTTRPSWGSARRSTSPVLSSWLTRLDIDGCVTPSPAASSVKRRAPVRSIVASVESAVRLRSRCRCRMLSVASANRTPPTG